MGKARGGFRKPAADMDDLASLARMFRELQAMGASINPAHPCQYPLAAARATVFAAWAEISGEVSAWSCLKDIMLPDGRSARVSAMGEKEEPDRPMYRIGVDEPF